MRPWHLEEPDGGVTVKKSTVMVLWHFEEPNGVSQWKKAPLTRFGSSKSHAPAKATVLQSKKRPEPQMSKEGFDSWGFGSGCKDS